MSNQIKTEAVRMKSSRGGWSHRDYINRARRELPGDHRRLVAYGMGKFDEEESHVKRDPEIGLEHNTFMHQLVRLHINTDFGPSP